MPGGDGREEHGLEKVGRAPIARSKRHAQEALDVRLVVSTVQVLAEGHGWERWGMIPSELVRLQRLIHTTRASGVVLLSGDRHIGALYKLPATGGEASAASIARH